MTANGRGWALAATVVILLMQLGGAGCLASDGSRRDGAILRLPHPAIGEHAEYSSTGRIGFWPDPDRTFFHVAEPAEVLDRMGVRTQALAIETRPIMPDPQHGNGSEMVWVSMRDRLPMRIDDADGNASEHSGRIQWIARSNPDGSPFELLQWWLPAFPIALSGYDLPYGEPLDVSLGGRMYGVLAEHAPEGGSLVVTHAFDDVTWTDGGLANTTVHITARYSFDASSVFPRSVAVEWYDPRTGPEPATDTLQRTAYMPGREPVALPAVRDQDGPNDPNPSGSYVPWGASIPGSWDPLPFSFSEAEDAARDDSRVQDWYDAGGSAVVVSEAEYRVTDRNLVSKVVSWRWTSVDAQGRSMTVEVGRELVEDEAIQTFVVSVSTGYVRKPPALAGLAKLDLDGVGTIIDSLTRTDDIAQIRMTLWPSNVSYPRLGPGLVNDWDVRWEINGLEPCFEARYTIILSGLTGQIIWWQRGEFEGIEDHPQRCISSRCDPLDCLDDPGR